MPDGVFPPFLDLPEHARLEGRTDSVSSVSCETEPLGEGFENPDLRMELEKLSGSNAEVRRSYLSDGAG